MQINISARHGQLSSVTQEKIKSKYEKLRRLFDRISAIDVTVDLAKENEPNIEVQISVERSEDMVAAAQGEFWESVDKTIHKLEQQLRKHKEKLTDRRSS